MNLPPKMFHYLSGEKKFNPFNGKFTRSSQNRHGAPVRISGGTTSAGRISAPMFTLETKITKM
jgi:hypothetical protein